MSTSQYCVSTYVINAVDSMSETNNQSGELNRSFEDLLDNISDYDSLFNYFWDYLSNAFSVDWGCFYWNNPIDEKWRADNFLNKDKIPAFPEEVAEIAGLVDRLYGQPVLCAFGICPPHAPYACAPETLHPFTTECIIMLFGTELRAPAFLIFGPKSGTEAYSADDIDDIRKALKSCFRVYEKIEITAQLVAADKNITVSEVAAGIAHEINNNITPIIGRAQLLKCVIELIPDKELAKKLAFNTDIIYSQSCKIARITQNLSHLSQPIKIEFKNIDLEKIIRQSVDIMSETAGKIKHFKLDEPDSQFTLKFDYQAELPLIKGDSQQLEQVFINLIINAAHAIEEKGKGSLTVGTKSGEDNTVIGFVEDTGTGMSSETQEKMWKPFYTTKKKGKGTGLGMAIVKNVVRAHGAEVIVKSKLGEGTRFEIVFKAIQPE